MTISAASDYCASASTPMARRASTSPSLVRDRGPDYGAGVFTLLEIHERLAGVVIECLPWPEFLARYDSPTLFHLDPPYWRPARSRFVSASGSAASRRSNSAREAIWNCIEAVVRLIKSSREFQFVIRAAGTPLPEFGRRGSTAAAVTSLSAPPNSCAAVRAGPDWSALKRPASWCCRAGDGRVEDFGLNEISLDLPDVSNCFFACQPPPATFYFAWGCFRYFWERAPSKGSSPTSPAVLPAKERCDTRPAPDRIIPQSQSHESSQCVPCGAPITSMAGSDRGCTRGRPRLAHLTQQGRPREIAKRPEISSTCCCPRQFRPTRPCIFQRDCLDYRLFD